MGGYRSQNAILATLGIQNNIIGCIKVWLGKPEFMLMLMELSLPLLRHFKLAASLVTDLLAF
jgi:hypothetical protein